MGFQKDYSYLEEDVSLKLSGENPQILYLNKGSMSFMTNYIGELEKLIIDDDVDFYY